MGGISEPDNGRGHSAETGAVNLCVGGPVGCDQQWRCGVRRPSLLRQRSTSRAFLVYGLRRSMAKVRCAHCLPKSLNDRIPSEGPSRIKFYQAWKRPSRRLRLAGGFEINGADIPVGVNRPANRNKLRYAAGHGRPQDAR
jgi:hypothetical protein